MKRASRPNGARMGNRAIRSGFTLLEMVMVLLIIAILFGVSVPALQSAFSEQGMRGDSHQLAIMVKTAMIQCNEQHRPYVIELSAKSMAMHPEASAALASDDPNAATESATADTPTMADVSLTTDLDSDNKIQVPDLDKKDKWVDMPDNTAWTFQPGQLCPASTVRIVRGDAYIELNFNALTGNIENEGTYIP